MPAARFFIKLSATLRHDLISCRQLINVKTKLALTFLLGICFAIGLSGCKTMDRWLAKRFHASPLQSEDAIAKLENKYADLLKVEDELETAFRTNSISSAEAARRRDGILNDLIRISDYHYDIFKHKSFTDNAAWNSGFDLTSIGLSSVATLVGGPAAQALSATDTGLKAAQGKISERWVAGRTIPVLVSTMDGMRAETLTAIYQKMGKPYNQFGISEGVRMVAKYHQQASLLEAMNRLAAEADKKKIETENDAAEALRKR
jgi:hypothetical protein